MNSPCDSDQYGECKSQLSVNQTDSGDFTEVNKLWLGCTWRIYILFLWAVRLFVVSDILLCNTARPLRHSISQLGLGRACQQGHIWRQQGVIPPACCGLPHCPILWLQMERQNTQNRSMTNRCWTCFELALAGQRHRPDNKPIHTDGAFKLISKGQNDMQNGHGGWHLNVVQTGQNTATKLHYHSTVCLHSKTGCNHVEYFMED